MEIVRVSPDFQILVILRSREGSIQRLWHIAHRTLDVLRPARGRNINASSTGNREVKRQPDLAELGYSFLFDLNGLAVDVECLARGSEKVQHDASVGSAVEHLLRQLGNSAAEVTVAAEGVACLKTPFPCKRVK